MRVWIKSSMVALLCGQVMVAASTTDDSLAEYCQAKGGKLIPMTATFVTKKGTVKGINEQFCTFERDHGYIVIGLSAFASPQPNIAATYMKNLPELAGKSVWTNRGPGNPSAYVCKNLGGTSISMSFPGSFKPVDGGDADICVFGDGSMVSAWSLIYMANHRAGYDEIKAYVRSEPLDVPMPS